MWTLIGLAILGYLLFRYVLSPVSILFPIAIVATVLVYLMNPLVTGLERRGLGRGWGTALIYVVFFIVFGVGIAFLVPIIVEQVQSFADSVPISLHARSSGCTTSSIARGWTSDSPTCWRRSSREVDRGRLHRAGDIDGRRRSAARVHLRRRPGAGVLPDRGPPAR